MAAVAGLQWAGAAPSPALPRRRVECPAVSSQQDPAGDREVFRSAGSVVLWWVWVVIAVITLADLAVQGRDHTALVMALLVAAITGVVYGCALRPRIIAAPDGITVANPLRDHWVPWASVVKVDMVNAVRVHCAATPGGRRGRILYSWAVQSSARSARNAQLRAHRAARRPAVRGLPGRPGYGAYPGQVQEALDRTPAQFAAHQLDERAQRARNADPAGRGDVAYARPEVRWAWGAIAAMVLPAVALIVVALI